MTTVDGIVEYSVTFVFSSNGECKFLIDTECYGFLDKHVEIQHIVHVYVSAGSVLSSHYCIYLLSYKI